jgi:hypothetical protein
MISTQQKASCPVPRRGAANNQQRPQPITAWPEHNPGETRPEREIARVLRILDEIKPGGGPR